MINIKIANLAIGIDNRYPNIEYIAADYLTDEAPVFSVSASEEDIIAEREMSGADLPNAYYEITALYRKIAEKIAEYDGFLFHGSVIDFKDKAYVITAKSGVGKTTHTGLWLSEFGDEVSVINGDKPIIRFIDGTPYAFGTPWKGKEGYGRNISMPLSSIAFLERAVEYSARAVTPDEVAMKLISQIYIPKFSDTAPLALSVADRLLTSVRLVRLKCNLDPTSADVSLSAMRLDNNSRGG